MPRKYMSPEIVEDRLKICSVCDFLKTSPNGTPLCGSPNCHVCRGPGRTINDLVRWQEISHNGLMVVGCTHPSRKQGKGWKK